VSQHDQASLEALAAAVGQFLLANGERLATAESCTGGWLGQCLTAVAGSSAWFERGFITYSNDAKIELLGVTADTLAAHGAVSEATAMAMALGTLQRSRADWALAITGVAGPGGGGRVVQSVPSALPGSDRMDMSNHALVIFRAAASRCGRSRLRMP